MTPESIPDYAHFQKSLSHDPLWMVSPRILPKLGDGNEHPAANAPCWQTPRRDQVVQCSLANGEHLCCLLSARQDFAFQRQELASHKTITMSARYCHLSPEHRLSVIDRIATMRTEKNGNGQPSL
jgi:hypothetical protein